MIKIIHENLVFSKNDFILIFHSVYCTNSLAKEHAMFKRSLVLAGLTCIAPAMASNYISFDTAPLPKGLSRGPGNINLSRGMPTAGNGSSNLLGWGINITTNLAIYGVQTLWNMKKESDMEKIAAKQAEEESRRKEEEKIQQREEMKEHLNNVLNEFFRLKHQEEEIKVEDSIQYAQEVLDEFKRQQEKEDHVNDLREGMQEIAKKFKENLLLK